VLALPQSRELNVWGDRHDLGPNESPSFDTVSGWVNERWRLASGQFGDSLTAWNGLARSGSNEQRRATIFFFFFFVFFLVFFFLCF